MPSTSSTKPKGRRQSTGRRDRAVPRIDRDPALARHERTAAARYERQRQQAIERGEPTSVGEALDQSYDAGVAAGERKRAGATPSSDFLAAGAQQQPQRSNAASNALSSLPRGSLGIGSMVAPLLVETVLITADEFIRFHRWPVPSRYLAAFFVFGGLSLTADTQAARASTVTAWGLVLATTYAFVSSPGGGNVLAGIGNFFGGSPTTPAASPAPPTTAQVQPVA